MEIRKSGEIIFFFPGKDDKRMSVTGRFRIIDSRKLDVNLNDRNFIIIILSCQRDRLMIQENR